MHDKIIEASKYYSPQLYDMGLLSYEEELYAPLISTLDAVKGVKSLQDHAWLWLEVYGAVLQSH